MEIFQRNMEALDKKYHYLAQEIRKINIDNLKERIFIEQTSNGMKILCVMYKGRTWCLNSKWNPEIAAEIYAERYQIRLYQEYFVFGFSDGRCIRRLLEKCDDTNYVVVCEPDIEVFCMACHHFDICDMIEDNRIIFYIPQLEKSPDTMLHRLLDYSRTKLVEFCILPSYDLLYNDACTTFMDSVAEQIRNEVVHKNTRLGFNRMIPQHTLFHMKNLIYHRNIEQLRQALSKYDLKRIPAIIVSAGPSLDKNVADLKYAQGKAFIVVVDAAIRTVLRAGIRPDIICTIDPESPDRFFENLDLEGMFWSCTRLTRPDVVKKYAKNIFYHGFFYTEWNRRLERELGYPFPDVASGGSVSAEAFALAIYLGFSKIILVGQDMAFTNGISHTNGIEGAFGDNDEYIQSRYRVQVEGIDGNMLETDFQMWCYRQWFEKAIRLKEGQVEVINATEGGAKIAGAPNCSLKSAISDNCRKTLDIHEIEGKIEKAFSEKQQRELLDALKTIKKEVVDFIDHVEMIIAEQEQIKEKVRNKAISGKELLFCLKKMVKQDSLVEEEAIWSLVSMYAQKEEYEIGECIYTDADISTEELIEKNLLLLQSYVNGAKLLQEDIEEFIMKD